jgi:hypothetical protein
MTKHVLTVVAYLVATFATQALSHFVVNVEHYAAVTFMRAEPIFALGVATMVIQGTILSYLYSRMAAPRRSIGHAVGFSWLVGGVLVSYIALAEPSKYVVPDAASWIAVELLAGLVQFTAFGVLLGFVYRGQPLTATV